MLASVESIQAKVAAVRREMRFFQHKHVVGLTESDLDHAVAQLEHRLKRLKPHIEVTRSTTIERTLRLLIEDLRAFEAGFDNEAVHEEPFAVREVHILKPLLALIQEIDIFTSPS